MALRTFQWLMCGAMTALGCARPTPPVPLADFRAEIADVVCGKYYGCCDDVELAPIRALIGDDEAACRMNAVVMGVERVEAGAQGYDPNVAGECIRRTASYTCAEMSALDTAGLLDLGCTSAFRGLVQVGEVCEVDADCADGHFCSFSGGAMRCRPQLADGASCTDSPNMCLNGSRCRGLETCEPLRPLGAPCADEFDCLSRRCAAGSCVPRPPVCDGQ